MSATTPTPPAPAPTQPTAISPNAQTPTQPIIQTAASPAPSNSQPAVTVNPTTDDAPAPAPALTPASSLLARLDAAESHWRWKLGLRAFLVITGLIGIGCVGWAVSATTKNPYTYALDDAWTLPWALITFGISVLWCLTCMLVLFLRRPHAPVHPGVAVGVDLIIWLAFIATALFTLVGVLSVMRWGEGGTIGSYSAYGYYFQENNGTWVWNATDYDTYFGRARDCSYNGRSEYSDYDGFSSCAEEDSYINTLWADKSHRVGVEMVGTVCQFIGLFVHLALFIWACVDTHYRNSRKTSKEAEKLATDIVMNMVRGGAIVQHPTAQGYQVLGGNAGPVRGQWPQYPQQTAQPGWPQQQAGWTMPGPAYAPQMRMPQALPLKNESSRFA
ncbi:hypothetical protein EJ04DRAFT_510037 [Polyplosphaeria fusca]|uniref:Uncharacterized protein n=1 Tax=Polyplosphaeria fusca TaxID=682080 RepID=A0A9P4V6X3_9PLEO|nr:hypothetical protein EJ04DRAFT_510037 [Polyplosphaeria fusca]